MIHHITVSSEPHIEWGMKWILHDETLAALIAKCGTLPEYGWWQPHNLVGADNSNEPWGWYPIREDGEYSKSKIGFWFRGRDDAIYFKLLWR